MLEAKFIDKLKDINFIKNYEFEIVEGRLYPEYLYKYIKQFIDCRRFSILDYCDEDDLDMDTINYILSKVDSVKGHENILSNTYDKVLYYYKYYGKNDLKALVYYLDLSIKNNLKPVDTEILKWYLVKNHLSNDELEKLNIDYEMALLLCKHRINIFDLYCMKNNELNIEEMKVLIDISFDSFLNYSMNNFSSSDIIFHNEELVRYLMDKNVFKAYDYYQDYCVENDIDINEELIKYAINKGYLNIAVHLLTPNIINYIIEKYQLNDTRYTELINYIITHKFELLTDKQILKLRYFTDVQPMKKRIGELVNSIDNSIKNNEISDNLLNITDDLYVLRLMSGKRHRIDDLSMLRLMLGKGHGVEDKIYTKYEYIKTYIEYNQFIHTINKLINNFSLACSLGETDKKLDIELFNLAIEKGYRVDKNTHIDILTNRDFVYTYLIKCEDIYVFDMYLELGGALDIELIKIALNNMEDIKNPLYKSIFKNREYVKELIRINPLVLDEYYLINGDIDDELIRSAIEYGYEITDRSPIVIKSNLEYIKLCIENIILSSANNVIKSNKVYDVFSSLTIVNNDHKLIREIIDLCIHYQIQFGSSSLFNNYELCEYVLDNANYTLKSIVTYYEKHLVKHNFDEKKPDFNLWLKQIYRDSSLNINFDKLSNKENEILILFSLYLETFGYVYISDINQLSYYVTKDGFTNAFYELLTTNNLELMLSVLKHNTDKINNVPDFIVDFFRPYFEENYSKDKIDYLINQLGNNVLLVNIDSYLQLDIEVLKKIVNLFKIEPFEFTEFNDKIYDSLKQEQFKKEYPIFSQIYTNISHAIDLNNINDIDRFKYLFKTILIDYSKNDEEIHDLELEIDKEIEGAIEEYKCGNIDLLHIICNKLTRLCREIYRDESNDIFTDLKLEYDEKDFIKKATLYILDEINTNTLFDSDFDEKEIEMIKKVIKKDKSLKEDDYRKYGSKLRKFYEDVNRCILSKQNSHFNHFVVEEYNVKRSKELPAVNYDVLKTISRFDINELVKIVKDEELYNNLCYHLHYYKIPMIPNVNNFINNKLGIEGTYDFSNIMRFIKFYKNFLQIQLSNINSGNKTNVSISDLKFSFIDLFNYFININNEIKDYLLLFGREDYKLLVTDPGQYPSHLDETKKMLTVMKYIPSLYTTSITIPSFDKNITYNNKEINVIVGNRSNMCNLTHGERTDACMRAGGIGDSLYDFCLTSPNGFHIRFEEPNTHEYISRVSGFRNGNTVFLNQLRYSCNKDLYSSEELIEYLKIVANMLIELTRDSKCPIENVCISSGYAMSLSKLRSTNLNIKNIKEGLGNFYSDVRGSDAIILASSNNGVVNLDNTNIPSYKPVRDKVYGIEIGIDKLTDKINIVKSNKTYLIGKSTYNIEEITDIMDGYVGTDFYVYIDCFYDIHYDYFDMVDYHDKESSYEEMIKYKEILMNKYNISSKRY